MTDSKKKRAILLDYTTAAREIELAAAAIMIIEGLNSKEAQQAVKVLQRGQARQLRRLDAAAAKLGAPHSG